LDSEIRGKVAPLKAFRGRSGEFRRMNCSTESSLARAVT
jgi:hypothetical protein